MEVTALPLDGLLLIAPRVFSDARGRFFESFSQRAFEHATGLSPTFVQDNHSISAKGVLRGMHYQVAPHAQGKLVRVVVGAAFDVALDLRRASPTFGKWTGIELSAANRFQLWIPVGFAHGFLALEEGTEFLYKTSDYYDPASERSIAWDDPDIGIDWPAALDPIVSEKDQHADAFRNAAYFP